MWTRNFLRMVKRKILHGHNIYVQLLCRFKQGHTHVIIRGDTFFYRIQILRIKQGSLANNPLDSI